MKPGAVHWPASRHRTVTFTVGHGSPEERLLEAVEELFRAWVAHHPTMRGRAQLAADFARATSRYLADKVAGR